MCIPAVWFDEWLMTAGTREEALVLAACGQLFREEDGVRLVDEVELLTNSRLLEVIESTGSQTATSRIIRALNRSVRRGALVRMWVGEEGAQRTRYVMPAGGSTSTARSPRRADSAEVDGAETVRRYDATAPSVFRAYEDAVGMLTPLVADQIQQALQRHPAEQVLDAIREAVRTNRRNWRYIQHVLQNWSGPDGDRVSDIEVNHETNQRRDQERLDPDQYRGERHLERARNLQVRDL